MGSLRPARHHRFEQWNDENWNATQLASSLRTALSVAVASNLHPSGFDTIMPKTLASAAVDRLLHHAHIVIAEGTSLCLAEATSVRGVTPLNTTQREVK